MVLRKDIPKNRPWRDQDCQCGETCKVGNWARLGMRAGHRRFVGLVAYNVSRRTREIAYAWPCARQASDVMRLVRGKGPSVLVGMGTVIGGMGSAVERLNENSMLFNAAAV